MPDFDMYALIDSIRAAERSGTPGAPVYKNVEIGELVVLLRCKTALEAILDMTSDAFERGDIREASHLPVIALSAKVMQEAQAALGL